MRLPTKGQAAAAIAIAPALFSGWQKITEKPRKRYQIPENTLLKITVFVKEIGRKIQKNLEISRKVRFFVK